MELIVRKKYEPFSDREIVSQITAVPHDEKAATYLFLGRYSPLLHQLFLAIVKDMEWYDYAVDDLYMYLRGEDGEGLRLRASEWRSSFGYFSPIAFQNQK